MLFSMPGSRNMPLLSFHFCLPPTALPSRRRCGLRLHAWRMRFLIRTSLPAPPRVLAQTTRDGLRLHAWMMWPRHWSAEERRRRPTVLFCQENAGNMAFRYV